VASQLKRTSPLPLYHQIANVLRSRLDLHEWAPREQLPAESALAASFQVSPLTVRQAVALLVQEGRLQRHQGRGTFVTDDAAEVAGRVRLTVPYHDLLAPQHGLKLRLLDVQRVRGPSGILHLLGITPGQEMVRIRRMRLRQKRPVSYTVSHLAPRFADVLTARDLRKESVVQALEETTGVTFSEVEQIVEASLADEDAAQVLEIPVGSPLLLVQRNYKLEGGETGIVVMNRYPGHALRFEIRFVRHGANRREWRATSDAGQTMAEIS
jgi:GntR family transcriptional regulator